MTTFFLKNQSGNSMRSTACGGERSGLCSQPFFGHRMALLVFLSHVCTSRRATHIQRRANSRTRTTPASPDEPPYSATPKPHSFPLGFAAIAKAKWQIEQLRYHRGCGCTDLIFRSPRRGHLLHAWRSPVRRGTEMLCGVSSRRSKHRAPCNRSMLPFLIFLPIKISFFESRSFFAPNVPRTPKNKNSVLPGALRCSAYGCRVWVSALVHRTCAKCSP